MDGLDQGVRGDRDAVDAFFDEELGEFRKVGGALATDAYLDLTFLAGPDQGADHGLDGFVAFVVKMGHQRGVPVEAEGKLGEIVGTDGKSIDMLCEFPGKDDIRRKFGHKVY